MGMDIYAGTLTRYYNRDWKTAVQVYAEENGLAFHTIYSQPQEELPSPQEVMEWVCEWRDGLTAALTEALETELFPWDECHGKEYRTDKPDWDAFGALVLYEACQLLNEPLPETVRKNWDWGAHPLICRAADKKENGYSLLAGAELWLPYKTPVQFGYPDIQGNSAHLGTVGGLLLELENLNKKGWQADAETIREWRSSEGYPADLQNEAGDLTPIAGPHTIYNTESLAKFCFSILYELASFANETGVPLKLDY